MKQTAFSRATNLHPALAFHREVLSILKWITIREELLEILSDPCNGIKWIEKDKLRRHSREALGKWILSQVARTKTKDVLSGFFSFVVESASQQDGEEGDAKYLPKASSAIYSEQLIRDLSLKSDGVHNPAVIERIKTLLQEFDLYGRCLMAYKLVQEELSGVDENILNTYNPSLRKVSEDDNFRTNYQKRIQGLVAQINVTKPRGSPTRKVFPSCPPASIPWAAWEKLSRCYEAFGATLDGQFFASFSRDQCFVYRAATVVLRYEVGLATGSLQLCADVALKQHLHARGYHILDLCASPINAYMEAPQLGSFTRKGGLSSKDTLPEALPEERPHQKKDVIVPNHFCSAFYDTDFYFGSIGNALHVDPASLYNLCSGVIKPKKPLLLTLDVPYDEDICELLFQKLAKDMNHTMKENKKEFPIDYLLVIPLWWDVPMPINKLIFTDDASGSMEGNTIDSALHQKLLVKLLQKHSEVLEQGYRVSHHWTEALGAAARANAKNPSRTSDTVWAVFDGVFVGNTYPYFCASTNRPLWGVTTTEVIGLRQPRPSDKGGLLLKEVLNEFYGV